MIDTKKFVDVLINRYGVQEFCGVSDSTLKFLINETTNRGVYIPFTNEGDAVAYAAGRTLGGVKTAVLMQNSGLTNASSPISSLTSLYRIPMIYIVGWRGHGRKDEPQHRILGETTEDFIRSITDYSDCDITTVNDDCTFEYEDILNPEGQLFILIDRDRLSKVDLEEKRSYLDHGLNRLDCIDMIKDVCNKSKEDVFIISTTGYTSRELMSLNEEDPHNFYMLGSMGCIYSFVAGISRSHPDKKFIILDGDGSLLMRPSGYFTCRSSFNLHNVFHIVFNNMTHLSTGGQDIPSSVYLDRICGVYGRCKIIYSKDRLEDYVKSFVNGYFNEMTVVVNTNNEFDKSLPRPVSTPEEIRMRFEQEVKKDGTSSQ